MVLKKNGVGNVKRIKIAKVRRVDLEKVATNVGMDCALRVKIVWLNIMLIIKKNVMHTMRNTGKKRSSGNQNGAKNGDG